MLPFKENDNQKEVVCLNYSVIAKISISEKAGTKTLDVKIIAALLPHIQKEEIAGIASEDVPSIASSMNSTGNDPQAHKDSTRASMIAVLPSTNNAPSSSNQNPIDAGQVATGNQVTPSSSRVNTSRQATNGSRAASHIAAPKRKVPATTFNPTPKDAIAERNAGEIFAINAPSHAIEIEYDAPQMFATSSNARNSSLLKIVEDTGVEDNLAMNAPIGIHNNFPQYLNLEVPESYSTAPPNFEDNRPASSSQTSSCSLSNAMPTDAVTHQTTLSIAPPPRMIELVMKKVSNEMKHREESACLDFGLIPVKLTAAGKELDDSISFLNNLKAQLESAKQGGSYQQL